MPEESKKNLDLFNLAAWGYENRKRLIGIGSIVAAIAIIYGLYSWHAKSYQDSASNAFDAIKLPAGQTNQSASDAAPYLKLANDYQATSAAARALIIAGGILFDAGKYPEAQAAFDKYLTSYRDFPLTSIALFGVGACLEAQGKTADALQRYEALQNRPQDYVTIPAKAALARLYVQTDKPELALRQYAELLQLNAQDSWTAEAQSQAQEILAKHPELRQKLAPPPSAAPAQAPAAPKS